MTYSATGDPHGGASTAAAAWVTHITAGNSADAQAIVDAYQQYAPVVNIASDLALAQAVIETGNFASPAWMSYRNPAGIGITSSSVAGPNFQTIPRGVQAHLALLNCYFGNGSDPWSVLSSVGYGGFSLGFTRLNQLNGVWAVPGTTYGEEIATLADQVIGSAPPAPAPNPPPATVVTGQDVLNVAMQHLGDSVETDRNGTHPVDFWCEATREDWHQWAGVPQPIYSTALAAASAKPLNPGIAPAGASVFFQGAQWSIAGHTGVALGDGRTISGLATVVISSGWQDPAQGYLGWRYGDGVVASAPDSGPFFQEGNPYGKVPVQPPFWNRWWALENIRGGLGVAMMGWAVKAETTTANGRRIQQFERGWYGTQSAPDPWDCVGLMPAEYPKGS